MKGSEEDKEEMREGVNLNVKNKTDIMWLPSQGGTHSFLMYT